MQHAWEKGEKGRLRPACRRHPHRNPSRERGRQEQPASKHQKAGCRAGQTMCPVKCGNRRHSRSHRRWGTTTRQPQQGGSKTRRVRRGRNGALRAAARDQHTLPSSTTCNPQRPKSQDSLGGAAKTHRPRVTAKAGSNHGSPERGRRPGQPGPTETEDATLTATTLTPWREDAEARDPGSSSSSNQPAVQQGDSSQQEAATLPRPSCEQAGTGQRTTSHCLPTTARADSTGQQPTLRASNSRPGARASAAAKGGTSRNGHTRGSQTGPASGGGPATGENGGSKPRHTKQGGTANQIGGRQTPTQTHNSNHTRRHRTPPQTHPSRGHNSNHTRRHRTPPPGLKHRAAATENQQKRRQHKAVRTQPQARKQKARSRKKQRLAESSNSQPVSA